MIIPEQIFLNELQLFFKQLTELLPDYRANAQKSYIYSLFHSDDNGDEIKIDNFEFVKNLVDILERAENDQKGISIDIGYNLKRVEMGSPAIHVLMPNESIFSKGIGEKWGYQGDEEYNTQEKREVYTNTFDAQYNILITSANMMEVLLIYNLIKALFISKFEMFEHYGFMNCKINGADVQPQFDVVPPHIYHRNFGLNFAYDFSVPAFDITNFAKSFQIKSAGTITANPVIKTTTD